MKSVSFLLPGPCQSPGGGYKMILEHANHLASIGCKVYIVCPISINWLKESLFYKINTIRLYIKRKFFIGYDCRKWFPLSDDVKVVLSFSLNYRHVPKSDIYIATEVCTAPYLNKYKINEISKFYYIQDYEDWYVTKDFLHSTYRYRMTKFVITHWLRDIVEKETKKNCAIVPNGFHLSEYKIIKPIEERDKNIVSMLYHYMDRKDIPTAVAALKIVKKHNPKLKVLTFGAMEKPKLPDWFDFYKSPKPEVHLWINNEAAIYIGSSKIEGFGLTVGEAMLCGQAVACTDNLGYQEMAKDGKTALLSPVGDAEKLADNILKLMNNDHLRCTLAQAGHDYVTENFSWDVSYMSMERVLGIYAESK